MELNNTALEALKNFLSEIQKAADGKLTDEQLKLLENKFKEIISSNTEATIAEATKTLEAKITEATDAKLKEVDVEYTKLFKESIDLLESKYTTIINDLTETAKKTVNSPERNKKLAEKISKFLDTFLLEAIGEKPIVDTVKMQRLEKFYDNVRQSVFVSNEDLHEQVSKKVEAVDGDMKQIKESLDKVLAEKITLNEQLNSFKKEQLLSESLKGKTEIIAEKVRKEFKDASLQQVTEAIKDTIVKIESNIDTEHAIEADKAKTPNTRIVESSTADTSAGKDVMDLYAGIINRAAKMNA